MAKMLPRSRRATDVAILNWNTFSLAQDVTGARIIYVPRSMAYWKKGGKWRKQIFTKVAEWLLEHENDTGIEVDKAARPLYVRFRMKDNDEGVIIYSGRYEINDDEFHFLFNEVKLK